MTNPVIPHPASYRDPSGFIFEKEAVLYRQVNRSFEKDFTAFTSNGCYDHLVKEGLLIPHQEIKENLTGSADWFTTLLPERVPFISYPWEWSFGMLKEAALLTLRLVKEAVAYGMILKDATPFNIQWYKGKMIFIDSLSFEKYNEQEPWIAYRQFCETFLGPLLLMHYRKTPLQELSLAYPDGIPLATIKKLLPGRSRFSLYTYLHIHLHAKVAAQTAVNTNKAAKPFSRQKLLNLIRSLQELVQSLRLPVQTSTWSHYYEEASQRKDYLLQKEAIIRNWVESLNGSKTCADLGANTGEFSRITAAKGIFTITADADPYCIESLYQRIQQEREENIHPLVLDLSHPSPAIGVNNEERNSFIQRTSVDLVMALALIHHLVIGKNIPFDRCADFFSRLGRQLIIEFVPKTDPKVMEMLSTKKDIFPDYSAEAFEYAFQQRYTIDQKMTVTGSERILYLMTHHEG